MPMLSSGAGRAALLRPGRLRPGGIVRLLRDRFWRIFVLALGPAVLLQGVAVPISTAQKPAQIIPSAIVPLGDAWATNSINTVIFRHYGLLTVGGQQIAAFYRDRHTLRLVLRDLASGRIRQSDLKGTYGVDDAHNTISIGVDRLGYLHLAYNHHATRLHYRRSRAPFSITDWTDELSMTGVREDELTYPTFIVSPVDASLLFLYRDGLSGKGQACFKRYVTADQTWHDIEPCVLSGAEQRPWTSSPYWNHPATDSQGKIHLSFVWRTYPLAGQKHLNNLGVDYAVSGDNARTWESSGQYKYRLPITQTNAETIFASPVGSNLINQTSMDVDSRGHPHVAYYVDDAEGVPQYQHLWFDGRSWHQTAISHRSTPFDLVGGGSLQLPISRPEILIDRADRVYFIFRADLTGNRMSVVRLSPPRYSPEQAEARVLWAVPLGHAEPIVDRLRWRTTGTLSMLIQWNGQPPHDVKRKPRSAPIYIVDWDLVENSNWDNGK